MEKEGLIHLDSGRAKEIVESLGVVEVLYNGFPVWIERLNGDTAEVRFLETGGRLEVPVTELVEGGSLGEEGPGGP
ncbi:MAG: Small acid-soluble spore protein [Clostridia bacterium 62_21]|uniref:Small acid-soluble spore protein n=1 Tax=Thermacetogenium phaeum (strain ATCC BAA-254 / DSM 26808 / PB) TaxID=1089553 RepID=K4LEC9_THEPS|nr:H-type small acid-soluble spore protein [Thermacetogenium phaeum]AFV10310.1 small acid-soluble spore protein [Thermacetogenium phaeum DSM 12270]KUK40653.1 MAG: Small acid-soluble spore protein [Clostridia bacterium 62_21]MDN5365919.1 hypothetical protein [Thermacetogenium sp.]MDN5376358.1 hypothetical protein [Thermacetogenium sp.]